MVCQKISLLHILNLLIDNGSYIWIYGLESFINNLDDDKFIEDKLAPLYTKYYKFHRDNDYH